MDPNHPRLDPSTLLVRHLASLVDHSVVTSADAAMDPRGRPVTVVQTPNVTQNGARARWSFRVPVTITTFGADPTAAYGSHAEVADGILGLTALDGGSVRVSSVTAVVEPEDVTSPTAPEWPAVFSTYTIFLRHERAT